MPKINLREINYEKVASYDAQMWRSYYNHQFFKLFWQLVQLIRHQLSVGWSLSIRLAFYAGWAAADYRIHKKKGVNTDRVLKNLTKFYQIISEKSAEPFDYVKAAETELEWWEVHRRSYQNNPALEDSLAENAAAIYNVPAKKLKKYAHYRAEAMILPRHEGDGQDMPTDWPEVESLLVTAWRSLHQAVQKH